MNKTIQIFSIVFLLSFAGAKANTINQSDYFNNDYLIKSSFDELNNVYLIKLKIPDNGVVNCIITDESKNKIMSLIECEMDKGEYNVYFRPDDNYYGRKFNCILNVHSIESGSLLYYNNVKIN